MNTENRVLEPGQMAAPAGEIRFLFLPSRDLFARRAERLRLLSRGHSLGHYLAFLALLADAQQHALNQFPIQSMPDPHEQACRREQGIPLLDYKSWPRHQSWLAGLKMILRQMSEVALPPVASETVASLMQASEPGLEAIADSVLEGDLTNISPQQLPFIAAALQVYWVHMVSSLKEHAFGRLKQSGLCPVCGSYPSVGIVRGGGREQGLRYLSCSLCASLWHMVRIKCSTCESTEGIDQYTLEGSNTAVRAESCNDCNSYLKLLYLAKDSRMEAIPDDLATLALDMLMDKEGKIRRGPSLFLHPGMPH